MEEIRSSPPSTTSSAAATSTRRRKEMSLMTRMKKGCSSFTVSLKECFSYAKATIIGQTKKLTARNEKEATAADLQAEKMQVEAADEAERTKNKLYKSI